MTPEDELAVLAAGAIEVEGRVVASSNQALYVTVTLDGVTLPACYKAGAGERRLWDFPGGLWRREVAAYVLDDVLGTGLIPPTVGRDDLPFGPGSLQLWVDDNGEDHYFTLRSREELGGWFADLAAFDVIANNADRKSGHVLFDGERCWAIDNGLCFHVHDKLRTVVWEFAGAPLEPRLSERLTTFAHSDGSALAPWLSPEEVALTLDRAGALCSAGAYPLPDEDREWPPWPWPLV
ncbi:MAG TPA: phosphatidylinositol kinase [Acidimicrobiales bacterium]|nr:phosphatidylinositol kinase [Acidimicrobiales bacterium]